MDKQELRNALCAIEDQARAWRKEVPNLGKDATAINLLIRLTKLVREEIVR